MLPKDLMAPTQHISIDIHLVLLPSRRYPYPNGKFRVNVSVSLWEAPESGSTRLPLNIVNQQDCFNELY